MSFERSTRPATPGRGTSTAGDGTASLPGPGKQTLTSQLPAAPVQQRAAGAAPGDPASHPARGGDVQAAAAHGTQGSGGPLPYLDQIQRSFGRHSVGGIQAHVGGRAAEGATAMGADAYATGNHVAFAAAPGLHTAAHEAAHVVQQRGGVQLHGAVGQVGDPYEQHADAVADLVVQGKSSEALLDRHASSGHGPASTARGPVQRHAFIKGTQVAKDDGSITGQPQLTPFVTDDTIRNYESVDELKKHAAGTIDYLGNLPDGTWLRFHPDGINLLGEYHTEVTLLDVMPLVHSHSFIYETFASDPLTNGSNLKTVYDAYNTDRFKKTGVENVPNKQQFGAESLYPKIGYGLTLVLPYLEGSRDMQQLTKQSGEYVGQPIQATIKYAWAYGKDVKAEVDATPDKHTVPAKRLHLAEVVTKLDGQLDAFITGLVVLGWLGDELVKPQHKALIPALVEFSRACLDAVVEVGLTDPSSRMGNPEKQKFSGKTSDTDKQGMFSKWRDFHFEDSVKDAASRGVRYAGMGLHHLEHLIDVGLPSNGHPYNMATQSARVSIPENLTKFRGETATLRSHAKK